MRDFRSTPEPASGMDGHGSRIYVVQEHHALSRHFDLRLEMDGVLVSWAVPKGIPEDASAKRLAVHVEDHPLPYGNFEGEIPKGNYGAGKVAIWDRGKWEPAGKNEKAWRQSFAKGKLTFFLRGRKLEGKFLLARMREEPNWLLRRVGDLPADAPDHTPEEEAGFVEPQLARVVSTVPSGKDWQHEIKFDGYRLIAVRNEKGVTLFTRNGHDWTERFQGLAKSLTKVSPRDFVLDGEAVVMDEKGRSRFGDLQAALKDGNGRRVLYVAFDLLHFDGRSLRSQPLRTRQQRLESLVDENGSVVRRSRVWEGETGPELFRQACGTGLEGIISKRADETYHPGTRRNWTKSKCRARQEFVVCGYTPPKGTLDGFGAILLGSYENGKLVARGKVGTGFTTRQRLTLKERFDGLRSQKAPYTSEEAAVQWLRPELVAEIAFAEVTRDGAIRQGSFIGLREDKGAQDVHLDGVRVASPDPEGRAVKEIAISHPDRIVYPDDGVTKIEVARYFATVGQWMMPYVAGRPLAILRAPTGISGELFFQKSLSNHVPEHVAKGRLDDGMEVFSISSVKGLVSLAQFGALEFHPWGATLSQPEKPEFLIWDLDPDESVPWKSVLGAAFLLRDILVALGLEPMVKTSGGKGLHIMLRIRRTHDWGVIRNFTKDVARITETRAPDQFTIVSAKAMRTGKIFIDWMRNGRGATCIAPWCLRARPGAKVSMPLPWDALGDVPPDGFDLQEPPSTPDEWLHPAAQSISAALVAEVAATGRRS